MHPGHCRARCLATVVLGLASALAAPSRAAATSADDPPVAAAEADAVVVRRSVALATWGAAAAELAPALHAAIAALPTVDVRSYEETRVQVAVASEVGLSCVTTDEACLARVAALLRVDVFVVATVESQAGGAVVDLVAVDAALGRAVARERTVVPRGDARPAALRDLASLLLEPDRQWGRVVVHADGRTVAVAVDDAALAVLPDDRVLRLRAGPHALVFVLDGRAPVRTAVDVRAGRTQVLEVRPASSSSPDTALAGPASGPPLAVVAAVVGFAATAVGAGGALAIDAGLGAGLGAAAEKETWQRGGQALLVGALVGAVVGAGGVVGVAFGAPSP